MESMESHGIHGIVRILEDSTEIHGIPWIPRNSMDSIWIPWNSMEGHVDGHKTIVSADSGQNPRHEAMFSILLQFIIGLS